jgi:hypothetical protein
LEGEVTLAELFNPFLVDINSNHVVTDMSERSSRHNSDVSATYNRDSFVRHATMLPVVWAVTGTDSRANRLRVAATTSSGVTSERQ